MLQLWFESACQKRGKLWPWPVWLLQESWTPRDSLRGQVSRISERIEGSHYRWREHPRKRRECIIWRGFQRIQPGYGSHNNPDHPCRAQRIAEGPIWENSSAEGRFLIWAHAQATTLLPGNVCALKINLDSTASLNSCNNIDSCVVPELTPSSPHFKVQMKLRGQNHCMLIATMVDCDVTTLFISKRFMKINKVHTHPLVHKIPLYNIDGSRNKVGNITHFIQLQL